MQRWFVVLVLLLLLAGCSSPKPSALTPTTTATDAWSTTGPTPAGFKVVQTTDTLHFLKDSFSTKAANGADLRVSITPLYTQLDPTETLGKAVQWVETMPDLRLLHSANFTLWMDLQGTVVAQPGSNVCFWTVNLFFQAPDGSLSGTSACAEEPVGVVAPGLRSLQFAMKITFDAFPAGTQLQVQPSIDGYFGPDGKVELVTGSAAHDSQITVPGLQVPV